jgi:hypothetical protein
VAGRAGGERLPQFSEYVLWSVGGKHLITTKDGQTWTQLFL